MRSSRSSGRELRRKVTILGAEPTITGTNSYEETAGSDVVVITAGLPRSPGMSRDDLVATNEKIVGSVTEQIVAQSPDCIIVILSNPLDAMCHEVVERHARRARQSG